MNWFLGSIQDAVATSKKRKAFFIVYIEGTDELSVIMTKVLDDPVVSRKFETNNFVAIKLAKGSEGHKQFEEFYKLVPVPSVFFIDQNGSPAEIVVSETSEENVLKKLNNAIEKCIPANKSNESLPGPSTSKTEQVPASTSSITKGNPAVVAEASTSKVEQIPSSSTIEVKPTIKTEDNSQEKMPIEVESSPSPMDKGKENNETDNEDINKSSPEKEKPPIEDRVERAKLLLGKKKEEKKEDEFKKEKEAELERRMAGQKLQQAKREQHEKELKQLKEERERQKKEEALARQRILDQIAQDRAERAQRLAMTGSPPPDEEVHETGQDTTAPSASPASPSSVNPNIGRLQFKLPSGETKSHSFPAETTLLQVREFIDNNIVLPFSEYSMATTFPRREFTARDNNRDLHSLQLLPSAVILILPVQGNITMRSSLGWTQMIIEMMWDIVQPVISLSRYISNLIFRRDDTVGGSSRNQSPPPPASTSTSSSTAPQTYTSSPAQRLGGRTSIKRRGNIYSLRDNQDDNDENNTWNGNSTQQM
uniref:UBX domain-containing protein 4 n=1 Tax=Panstrongylus megistus TaxID=65343 RepID=A0A069DZ80_9HEMI